MTRKASLFFLSMVFGVPFSPVVMADKKVSTEIKHKSRDLNKVQAEINRKKDEKERLKKEEIDITQSMQKGEEKIKNVEKTLLHTKKKNWDVELTLAQTKNDRDRLAGRIRDSRTSLHDSLQTYYVASAVLGPTTPAAAYSREIYRLKYDSLKELRGEKSNKDEKFENLTDTYQVLQHEVKKQESTLMDIKVGLKEKEKLLQKKMTRREVVEVEMTELQRTAEELASLIDTLRSKAQQEQEEEKRARRQKQVSGHSPIAARSLPWPVQGKVVKRFGRQQEQELKTTYISNGIMIESAPLSTVAAVGDGHVLFAGNFMSYGPMVVIEHSGDWYSVYGHLARWNVDKGQQLKKGEPLGASGVTPKGSSETYFELRFYGKPTDPLPWLAIQN
jgi:murein hydrolase activator